ncbi:MAG: helix-turn-helix domain-containing protein [Atopostipes suicloacalis]|nr:helix-turn-helix domain-containing protein [Atopostipes suicloacalis]
MSIGDIIQEQRELLKMTQEELAKGICSEKYIYLIEKNERNPSAFILNDLSERLGIGLFDFYNYSEYESNDLILKHRQNFNLYTEKSDLIALKRESMKASKLKSFQEEPLIYDISVIDSAYQLNVKGKTKETIERLNGILSKDGLVIGNIARINVYVLLSTAYQLEGEWDKAQTMIEKAYERIKTKTKFDRYNVTIISVLISLTALYFNRKDYKSLLEIALELKKLHNKYSSYNRYYYVNFYLAFAYFENEEPKKAKEYFMSGIHSALLFKSVIDIPYLLKIDGIYELAKDLSIDERYFQQLEQIVDEAAKS